MVWTPTGGNGTYFRSGKLYQFETSSITVMRGWPKPMAWRKTRDRDWHCHRPYIKVAWDPGPESSAVRTSEFTELSEILTENFLGEFDYGIPASRLAPPQLSSREFKEANAYRKFFEPIPSDVKKAMALFPDRQWHILALAARCPGALDLIFSNPALAWCLASNWVFHKPAVKQPMRAAKSLVRHKQREILDWLGFPKTESARRILRRVNSKSLTISGLLYLRASMLDIETSKILAHIPDINAGVIRLATDPLFMVHISPRFLQDVSSDPEELKKPKCVKILRDILRMADILWPGGRQFVVASAVALDSMHHELIDLLNRRNLRHLHARRRYNADEDVYGSVEHLVVPNRIIPMANVTILDDEGLARCARVNYPAPPIPGNANIVPIACTDDLYEEGIEQHNCVASYEEDILEGKVYIYRILYPERATLSIEPHQDDWQIDQLLAACNEPVSQETLYYVEEWLERKGENEDQLLLDWDNGHKWKGQPILKWETPRLAVA